MTDEARGRLAGKVALIFGGSSGIGLAIGARFAEERAKVALVGSSSLAKARSAAESVVLAGGVALPFVADVRSSEAVADLVKTVNEHVGDIDILVNAAGVWRPTPIDSMSEDQIEQTFEVNLKGPVRTVAAVAPGMIARRSGRIINIASIAGLVPSANYCLYAASKAGVIAFTKAAALDLAPHEVAINCIAPGNTATPMNAAVRTDPDMAERREWIRRITPSNRLFTPAEEIAEVALFLADGRVQGMHGAVISVDEGRSAGLASK